jgi:hypothetical protein
MSGAVQGIGVARGITPSSALYALDSSAPWSISPRCRSRSVVAVRCFMPGCTLRSRAQRHFAQKLPPAQEAVGYVGTLPPSRTTTHRGRGAVKGHLARGAMATPRVIARLTAGNGPEIVAPKAGDGRRIESGYHGRSDSPTSLCPPQRDCFGHQP